MKMTVNSRSDQAGRAKENKKITWRKPDGSWGIEGVNLAVLPPKVYGALCKLMELEHPNCPSNGDLIRSMSDEELADFLVKNEIFHTKGYALKWVNSVALT